ncbi:glycosyl transferase family 1 [Faecalibacterium sp. An77]|uniref:glycosyltransferase n=1 Tax=Faecalibacterium sp. An77 TaxID=1965655 RepID=UPI000B37149B|nr:glycosyltransferase [Faecalibacterium sp. An77]OUN38693.1 glycosyl transferase family 1 [Faecalibacterium sp. An77]
MKILLINKFLYKCGGTETYVFKIGQYLENKGHEVQYFGMDDERNIVGNRVGAYTPNMDFHNHNILVSASYAIQAIYSIQARIQIRKVLDDFMPDVCHLNNFNYQLTPSIILEIVKWRKENNMSCRIVFTGHDYNLVCPNHMCKNPVTGENCEKCLGGQFIHCIKNRCIHGSLAKSVIGTLEGYYWKLRKTYRYIDTAICCSEFLKTKLDTNPELAPKTVALHNFIDVVEDREVQKKDYVLYFGRYSEEKGIGTLLKVCEELPEVQFVFAGTGPLEKQMEALPNVKNIGFKSGATLEQLVRAARFSIYPSEWYENCPFSVMESQMYGTPVIGANIGGIPELIQAGKTGELFEAGNKEELKDKVLQLWNNPDRVLLYSENCKNITFDTIDDYYKKLITIYRGRN